MRRLLGPLIAVVILIGVGFALGIAFSGSRPSNQSPAVTVLTVPVLITSTTDPNATPLVRVITATPPPGVVVLPTGLIATNEAGAESTAAVDAPTIDPEIVAADAALAQTATALPENCILHTVAEGDTPFAIAETYGANGFDLMAVNGLTDETASNLQIGDVLIIPLPGCPLTAEDVAAQSAVAEVTEEATPEVTAESTEDSTTVPTATIRPTLTLPPTAVNAQLEIVRIINPGDITAEGVEIRNNGAAVNLTGWTLSDGDGNTFTFPEQRLFTGGVVTVNTQIGTNTPIVLYWGRSEAVWQVGDTVTLEDAVGTVQSSMRVQ